MSLALPVLRRSLLAALVLTGAVAQATEPGAERGDDSSPVRADAAPPGAALPPASAPPAAVPVLPVLPILPVVSLPSLSLAQSHTAAHTDSSAPHAASVSTGMQTPAFKLRERALQAQLVEMPAFTTGDRPGRPHHAVAFRSEAFRRFAHDSLGLDAERCLAPMVRLSAKLGRVGGGTGDPNATFWLLARCSLR